jgi:hypothetical protein
MIAKYVVNLVIYYDNAFMASPIAGTIVTNKGHGWVGHNLLGWPVVGKSRYEDVCNICYITQI